MQKQREYLSDTFYIAALHGRSSRWIAEPCCGTTGMSPIPPSHPRPERDVHATRVFIHTLPHAAQTWSTCVWQMTNILASTAASCKFGIVKNTLLHGHASGVNSRYSISSHPVTGHHQSTHLGGGDGRCPIIPRSINALQHYANFPT